MRMAKRFFDTDFFKKKFVRELEPCYKLLWFYIMTDCNHAGIWEVDFEIASIRLKCDLDEEKSAEIFANKILKIDNNEKWFLPSFIEFQYGKLNEKNNAHLSVIQILNKYSIPNLPEFQHLISPLQGAMDKDKDMDKVKDKDKDKKVKELREAKIDENLELKGMANTEIDELIKFMLEETKTTRLERGNKFNRFACEYVLEICSENFPDQNRVEIIKRIITATAKDKFHSKNMKGFSYLKNNFQKLIHVAKGDETLQERYERQKKYVLGDDTPKEDSTSITRR